MNHRCANLPQPIDAATSLECRLRLRLDPRRGFTIVELLVVTAVAILLISILVLAVSGATRAAQKSNTIALMDSIKKGLIQFKEDIGYYPRLLGAPIPSVTNARDLYPPPNPDDPTGQPFAQRVQPWYSVTSIPEFLVGTGHHYEDGYGIVRDDAPNASSYPSRWRHETPGYAIRHPGPDGIWGAAASGGTVAARRPAFGSEASPTAADIGKSYGPYIDLKDQSILAAVVDFDAQGAVVKFSNEMLPAEWEAAPKAIVDYWGRPIRYYRRPYPRGALGQSYRAVDRTGDGIVDVVPTLSDFYYLRPFEVSPREAKDTRFEDAAEDTTTSHQLDAAEFALLSTGPDKKLTTAKRYDDPEYYNRDNIIEVGP